MPNIHVKKAKATQQFEVISTGLNSIQDQQLVTATTSMKTLKTTEKTAATIIKPLITTITTTTTPIEPLKTTEKTTTTPVKNQFKSITGENLS